MNVIESSKVACHQVFSVSVRTSKLLKLSNIRGDYKDVTASPERRERGKGKKYELSSSKPLGWKKELCIKTIVIKFPSSKEVEMYPECLSKYDDSLWWE